MADWQAIRALARSWRREVAGSADTAIPAEDLIQATLDSEGLWTAPAGEADPALSGADALLLRDAQGILYNADLAPDRIRFNIAHEMAHWRIHDESAPCHAEDLAPDPVTDPLPYGEDAVRGYSPAQRREVEANVFAAEFLLPAPIVREQFLAGATPAALATTLGIPESTVLSQMAVGLLRDDERRTTNDERPSPINHQPLSTILDSSQRAAAEIEAGPTLVVAGPGTGKTRTLIARIQVLLDRGVQAERILALTFSNRAAEEMRERLSATAPEAARRVWIGTFHAFGLELLRRFGAHLGLPVAPALIDPLDSIALLESRLGELQLREYEYLHNPIFPFRDILSAISRAKDELVTPGRYAELAEAMAATATDDRQRHEAARALEVARVYSVWQRVSQEEGRLDFGDLLMRSVELLEDYPEVREQVRSEYPEILVDEYQDINRASAVLVRLIAGDGRGLWAVGDLRQAIYGFRGAAPANLLRFEEDFPGGRRVTLDVNYRSRPPIVQLFGAAAGEEGETWRRGEGATAAWTAQREDAEDSIVFAEAEDEEAQADGIVGTIRRFESGGIPLSEQAILLRTNAQAEAMSDRLERRGIPVVYLGDLLARPEVKDMLALLSLACESNAACLWRAAQIPEYATPIEDVSLLLARAPEENLRFPEALKDCGLPGLERLYDHIAPLAYRGDAHYFISSYLFGPTDYLRGLLRSRDSASRQSRLALQQLLQLARTAERRSTNEGRWTTEALNGDAARLTPHPSPLASQRAFLDHVRRLLVTREDTRDRLPAGAEAIPGVRLMTVHASKGLEFPVVFLPNLAKDLFPSRNRGSMVKAPEGMALEDSTAGDEDSRLFFVALSRARDHLVLSRPLTVGGKAREASPLLALIESALDDAGAKRERWSTAEQREAAVAQSATMTFAGAAPTIRNPKSEIRNSEPLPVAHVEQYMRCPRQFYYERVLRLPAIEQPSAYGAYQRCVWEAVRWVREERAAGRSPALEDLEARLETSWREHMPLEHPHVDVLRARASEIMASLAAAEEMAGEARIRELVAELPSGRIRIPLDHARENADGSLVVERYFSRRSADSDHTNPRLALTRKAARQRQPGSAEAAIELRYLASGETRTAAEQPRWEPARIEKYEKALQGIQAEAFEPLPSDDTCPFCPFFFVCPK